MRKILIILGIGVFIYAKQDIYLNYVNKLVNYSFVLKDVEDKKAPFEMTKIQKEKKLKKTLSKRIKITLISIFDNRAFVKIDEYLGDQLIKSSKKWIKINDKIYYCKVRKILYDKVIFQCKNKKLIKTVDKKISQIKESK